MHKRTEFSFAQLCPLLFIGAVLSWSHAALAAFCRPAPGPSDTCWPSDSIISAWLSTLSNETSVYAPEASDDLYLREIPSMNLLKSNYPAAVVVPGSESDLQKAVVFASRHRIRVVVRCSGHDFNGRSTGRGVMLIKTERLKFVEYDDKSKTVTFGSGCNHGDIYGALVPYGRIFVGGQSKTVCPAGCLAGGCHGLLSRQFGLGADSILEIRMMLFNGTIITATRNSHAQLLDAYLGAGQNSFGVALSFKARTYPAPPALYEFNAIFSILDPSVNTSSNSGPVPNVLSTFFMNVTWWSALPRGLSGYIYIVPDFVVIKLFYTAADFPTGYNAMVPLLSSNFITQVGGVKTYTDMAALSETNYHPAADLWQRQFISNVLVPPNQMILDGVIPTILETKPTVYMWMVFGGAVAEGTTGSMSPGMRSAMYEVMFGTQWHDPAADYANILPISGAGVGAYPAFPHSYNNEYTTWANLNAMPSWKTRFFRDYARLMAAKKRYDPCNLFTVQYGVGSDQPTATCGFRPKAH